MAQLVTGSNDNEFLFNVADDQRERANLRAKQPAVFDTDAVEPPRARRRGPLPMSAAEAAYRDRLAGIARESTWFMSALTLVRQLALPEWCIGAGAIRNLIWDTLHEKSSPSSLPDIDVAYFDTADTSAQRDSALQARLKSLDSNAPWEVTNQAGVHHWFEAHFGHPVAPLRSLEEAVGSWPEFATAVGISLRPDDSLRIIAPHGLEDLFSMVVRRNPARVSIETYRQRVAQKNYAARWPRVHVVPA